MTRYFFLSDEAAEKLREVARAEKRDPRAQGEVLLAEAIERAYKRLLAQRAKQR